MKIQHKRLLIRLVVVLAIAAVFSGVYQFIDDLAIAREANHARTFAAQSAWPAMSTDDARLWLESNGYRVVVWNPHDSRGFVGQEESSPGGKHLIVLGERQLRCRCWLVRPTWLDLRFRFTVDGAFEGSQADLSPIGFASSRPTA